jgi:ketosteroid isomerase-like protein
MWRKKSALATELDLSLLRGSRSMLCWETLMNGTENKQLMQEIFAGLEQGNSRLLVEAMSEDFCWTVTGATKWSKTYAGKQAVLNELFATLRSRIAGHIRTIADRFIADGDYVVVEAHGQNTTIVGKAYNNRYCFVFRLSGGKLKEVTEYLDTELVTATLRESPQGLKPER